MMSAPGPGPAPVPMMPEAITASGIGSEKLSLPSLQAKMKIDPEGYETELQLIYSQFKSSVELYQQQAAMSFTTVSGISADPTVAKDLGDRAMFLAHVAPFYPKQLVGFTKELTEFLQSSARTLPSGLRVHVTQALILLMNRKMIDIGDTLALFLELQTLGDRTLKRLTFSHVIHSIRRMNQKHKNDPKNRTLQNVLFSMLQQEDEAKAKRSLVTLCDLHQRKVWSDDRTANAICTACFHPSSRIMIAALSFLLDYEKIEDDDSDDSDSEHELAAHQPQNGVIKEAMYKANKKGTTSSKKKKKAKLQRAIRSMKKQQRLESAKNCSNYYSPLNHLKDAQGFVEKLFSRLQSSNERFQVKMMLLQVISRTVGLHRLILLTLYPYLQRYVQPHQRDVTSLLAAAVQACHDMVPPDAVEPLFKQIVNQFVHDRSRTEAITVGLNVVREICLRMPLLMTEELLQDLILYRKSHEKSVSSAARSLLTLFREVCPSLLLKKDRGRSIDPKARPKAFGEVSVAANVPGVELLEDDDGGSDDATDNEFISNDNDDGKNDENVELVEDNNNSSEDAGGDTSDSDVDSSGDDDLESDNDDIDSETNSMQEDEEGSEDDDTYYSSDNTDAIHEKASSSQEGTTEEIIKDSATAERKSKGGKRKFSDFEDQLNTANRSLRALKKLAGSKIEKTSGTKEDGILSNDDFQRIKELKAKRDARIVLTQHGFKIPSSEQLSAKRVDATTLEANIRKKLTKEERLALIRAGREDKEKYQARTAIKKKKTGGLSNRQKEHKKVMPFAAKKAKAAKSRQEKKKKQQRSGKQFRGRKAWK